MLKRNILIAILLVVITKYSLAQNGSAILFINGENTPIHFTVDHIHKQVLIDENGNGAAYRIIDSLYTKNRGIVKHIKKNIQDIKVRNTGNEFILDFSSIKFSRYRAKRDVLFDIYSASFIYFPTHSSRLGLQLDNSIFSGDYFIYRFGGMVGLKGDRGIFSDINAEFGLGFKKEWKLFRLAAVAGYSIFAYEKNSQGKSQTSYTIFVCPSIYVKVVNSKYFLAGGVNIYLQRSITDIPKDDFYGYFGVGANF